MKKQPYLIDGKQVKATQFLNSIKRRNEDLHELQILFNRRVRLYKKLDDLDPTFKKDNGNMITLIQSLYDYTDEFCLCLLSDAGVLQYNSSVTADELEKAHQMYNTDFKSLESLASLINSATIELTEILISQSNERRISYTQYSDYYIVPVLRELDL